MAARAIGSLGALSVEQEDSFTKSLDLIMKFPHVCSCEHNADTFAKTRAHRSSQVSTIPVAKESVHS